MEVRRKSVLLYSLVLVCVFTSTTTNALLSPKGVNSEVQALMAIKDSLEDPHGELDNWDADSVDPCSWTMVTCSTDNTLVIGLGTPSHIFLVLSLSKHMELNKFSNCAITKQHNISIPFEIGRLSKLKTLDLSPIMSSLLQFLLL